MLYPYCAQDTIMEMHSRDITFLIVLLFTVCTTPTCFSTFYRCIMVPTLIENSKFFCVVVLLTKWDCVIGPLLVFACIFVVLILISFKPPKCTPIMANLITNQFFKAIYPIGIIEV